MFKPSAFKSACRIAVAIAALSATSFAFNQWNVNGTSCVADSGSINNQLYLGTGGTVKFAAAKIGDIVLYCAVTDPGFKPTLLGITYYDDSRVAGNHVTAQLIKMDISTGMITTVVKVDSESGSVSANGKASLVPKTFVENYDFKNFAYYIRIDIIRNTPTANETIYAVALQD
jgi:hypothetical protein